MTSGAPTCRHGLPDGDCPLCVNNLSFPVALESVEGPWTEQQVRDLLLVLRRIARSLEDLVAVQRARR